MRKLALTVSAAASAMVLATAADARPSIGGSAHRVGSDASARATRDGASLIEKVAALIGFAATVNAAPVAGADAPRGSRPITEQCEEEKKRAEAAKAAETRRTAEAEKRQRGGEPVYLAF